VSALFGVAFSRVAGRELLELPGDAAGVGAFPPCRGAAEELRLSGAVGRAVFGVLGADGGAVVGAAFVRLSFPALPGDAGLERAEDCCVFACGLFDKEFTEA
jgi:hypothetical protein